VRIKRALLGIGAVVGAVAVWVAPAAAAPPENTAAPTISGTARVGQTLTAQNGTWSNEPTAFRYQWQRCDAAGANCANIEGAVEKTYLVVQSDQARTLRVVVFASNIDGVSSARSAQTGVVAESTAAQNTERPVISGTPRVGEQMTTTDGTWTNAPTRYAYQWLRCDVDGRECQAIQLAQSKNYQVRPQDIGFRLRSRVIAFNAAGAGAAHSLPSGVVVPSTPVTMRRPVLTLLSVRILGNRVYARFRICDDHPRNLTIFATDTKPGVRPQVRRYSTVVPPNPCGVYTRSWVPAKRFRAKGRYTVTIQVRDAQALTSAPARKTFVLR
jgi:hypothetical protein